MQTTNLAQQYSKFGVVGRHLIFSVIALIELFISVMRRK
jgi:hypothetical protein